MLSYVENRENIYEARFQKERECTNFPFLVLCMLLVLTTLIFFGYCLIFGNHDRTSKTFDDCGNFCGKLNGDNPFDCGPRDLEKLPFLHIEYELDDINNLTIKTTRKCVESCPKNFTTVHNICKESNKTEDDEYVDPKAFKVKLTTDLSEYIAVFLLNVSTFRDSLAIMCLFALFFSYIFVILFRFIACYVIWIISIGCICLMLGMAGVSVILWNSEVAMVFMTIGIVLIGFLYWFRRKISLVAKLFKESSRVMVDIPAIIFGPVLTFIAFISAFKLFLIITSIIHDSAELNRKLSENSSVEIYFSELKICVVAQTLNIITFVWFTQLILSCQHFMLAGTITKWYFIRDKEKLELEKPIKTTFSHLTDFNMGSACLGSMIIPSIKVLRMIMRPCRNPASDSKDLHRPLSSCFCTQPISSLVEVLHYPSRGAYIIVAKDGTPLFESGRRMFLLQSRNIMDIMLLSDFAAIVLFISRILVVIGAATFGYEILVLSAPEASLAIPLSIGAVIAFFIAHCFLSFYEMMIDSILVCFCIDCEENDGAMSPYYMPDNLKRLMMEMKEEMGGRATFGTTGTADGSDIPMLAKTSQN